MKGVFVPNMGLPKDCPYCPMAHWNKVDELAGCSLVHGKYYAASTDAEWSQGINRPSWCPLQEIEVPDRETVTSLLEFYDKEETHENCTVQVLTNTKTGAVSVGWWRNEEAEE